MAEEYLTQYLIDNRKKIEARNFRNESFLPKKNNKKIKHEILNQKEKCSDIEMNLTNSDTDNLYIYEKEEKHPLKIDTFEEKLLLFEKLITESKNDIKNLAAVEPVCEYMLEILKLNIVNRFKIINKLILFLHAVDYSLENTGNIFSDVEKFLNSDLWDLKPSKNEITIAEEDNIVKKNSWDDWIVDYEHMTIEKETMQPQNVNQASTRYTDEDDVFLKARLKNPRQQLWKNNNDSTWHDNAADDEDEDDTDVKNSKRTIKAQLTRSINDMEALLYPLKTTYILNPHKIINRLQSFPTNKLTRRALQSQQSMGSNENSDSKNTKYLLPVCIDYKKSFHDKLSTKIRGDIQNKNLLLHLHNTTQLKNKEHEGYCCYKELYRIDTFDMLLDTKLQQLSMIIDMTKPHY